MLDAGSCSIVAQKVVTYFFFTWKVLYCLWELIFISDPECMKDPVPVPVPQGSDRIRIHNTDQNETEDSLVFPNKLIFPLA